MANSDPISPIFAAALVLGIAGVVAGLNFLWPGLPKGNNSQVGATEERARKEFALLATASNYESTDSDCTYYAKTLGLGCQVPRYRSSNMSSALRLGGWAYLDNSSHGDRFRKGDLVATYRCKANGEEPCELSIYRVLKK